jgi:hypothetical protein
MAQVKVKFNRGVEGATNIVDAGTEGTRVATGTNAQRGTTQGQLRFNTDTGLAEYYTGTSFKSIDSPPTISSIDVTEVDSQAGGNQTIIITGGNFASGATVTFVGSSGTDFNASTVTVDNVSQITAVAPKSSFLNAQEPYSVKVTNASNLSATLADQINVDTAPTFDVASGSLGTLANADRASSNLTSVTATDADGDTITFSKISGTLPTGITFNSDGTFSGTANAETSDTTYTFTIRATANSKTSDRQYTITVEAPTVVVYSYTGATQTFTVPSGVTSIQAKVWGGAGAGHGEYYNSNGGAGGFGIGTIDLTGISSLNIVVGQGGQGRFTSNRTNTNFAVGGGTPANNKIATYGHLTSASTGENGGWGSEAGTGGGLSGIFNGAVTSQSNAIVIAGGGGASGSVNGAGISGSNGGYGGGFNQNGGDGASQSDGAHGRAGTTSAGGNNGTVHFTRNASSGYTTANGGALHGGHGNIQTNGSSEGGGGGSGYFGGGAGTHGSAGGTWSAGAGGSGYADTSIVSNITASNAGSAGATNSTATSDSNWVSGVGVPVAGDNDGGHGRVVISY